MRHVYLMRLRAGFKLLTALFIASIVALNLTGEAEACNFRTTYDSTGLWCVCALGPVWWSCQEVDYGTYVQCNVSGLCAEAARAGGDGSDGSCAEN
jgi:hypothetical protein